MRLLNRVICRLVGHRRRDESVTYDAEDQEFADVSLAQYAVCARCGAVQPSRVEVVNSNAPSEPTADD